MKENKKRTNKIARILEFFINLTIRRRLIIIIVLLALASAFILFRIFYKTGSTSLRESVGIPAPETSSHELSNGIDSILFTFGIKKEWISTVFADQVQSKQKADTKKPAKEFGWFSKNVQIPKDLNSVEVNLDLTGFINSSGLTVEVEEEIRTKDIAISVNRASDTAAVSPLVLISVKHNDKMKREAGSVVVILNNISGYSEKEIDEVLEKTSEFSFMFPRSLDDIDLQNKLLQMKKNVVINITIGNKDNYDSDFRAGMDDKEIKQKVKSFTSDFPLVNTVLLSGPVHDLPHGLYTNVTEELERYNLRVMSDTTLLKLPEGEMNRIDTLIKNLRSAAALKGKAIVVLALSFDEYINFYSEVMSLKKQGYKFYTLSDFLKKEFERHKEEQEEKLKTAVEENKPETSTKDKKTPDPVKKKGKPKK